MAPAGPCFSLFTLVPGFGRAWPLDHWAARVAPPCRASRLAHACITGPQGSGKSMLANELLLQHLHAGGYAWAVRGALAPIFDEFTGAHRIALNAAAPLSLNPLSLVHSLEDFAMCEPVLREWVLWLAQAADSADGSSELVAGALAQCWHGLGDAAGLTDVVLALQAAGGANGPALAARIRCGLARVGRRWFDGRCGVDPHAAHVSFDASRYSFGCDEAVLAGTVLVLHAVALMRQPRDAAKLLLLDEVSLLAPGERTRVGRLLAAAMHVAAAGGGSVLLTGPEPGKPTCLPSHWRVLADHAGEFAFLGPRPLDGWAGLILSAEDFCQAARMLQAGMPARALVLCGADGCAVTDWRVDDSLTRILLAASPVQLARYAALRDAGRVPLAALQRVVLEATC